MWIRYLLLVACLLSWSSYASGREWADSSGQFRIEAKLVTVKDGKAYLEKSDGEVIAVPVDRLSKADQDYLKSLSDKASTPEMGIDSTADSKFVDIHTDDPDETGEIRRFEDLSWPVTSLAYSPNGGFLAVGKMDKVVMMFEIDRRGRPAHFDKLEGLGAINVCVFTPDGKKLLTAGDKGRIQIWDVNEYGGLTEANRFVGHGQGALAVAISQDGQYALSGGKDKLVRFWNIETGREQCAVDGFEGTVKATFIAADGKKGMACDGKNLALIDLETGKIVKSMTLGPSHTQAVAISPSGKYVAVLDGSKILLWDVFAGRPMPTMVCSEMQWSVIFSPNEKYLLSGGGGKVSLWETETSRRMDEFDTDGTYYIKSLTYSPDLRHFAVINSSSGQTLQVFRLPKEFQQ